MALQGASALHTVELDSEKGPQLRVKAGREPAAFLSLWEGAMIVMAGRRGGTHETRDPRLFVVQGYNSHEKYVLEIEPNVSSLRSSGVFILFSGRKLFLWSGRYSDLQHQTFGFDIASSWRSNTPTELGPEMVLCLAEIKEGTEPLHFWECLLGTCTQYMSLSKDDVQLTTSPRLYHMSSVLGTFEVNEVKPEHRNVACLNNLNLNQAMLYEMEQPGKITEIVKASMANVTLYKCLNVVQSIGDEFDMTFCSQPYSWSILSTVCTSGKDGSLW